MTFKAGAFLVGMHLEEYAVLTGLPNIPYALWRCDKLFNTSRKGYTRIQIYVTLNVCIATKSSYKLP